MAEPTLFISGDGSSSILSEKFNVSYHSKHGAIQESSHVFLNAGLFHFIQNESSPIDILEVGFGSGLNAFMTYLAALKITNSINYISYESDPISLELAHQLNYPSQLKAAHKKDVLIEMHQLSSHQTLTLGENFKFTKVLDAIQSLKEVEKFDVVYFDAFAPNSQPELWTKELFLKLFKAMKPQGILVTYCAKGVVKRTLKEVGFTIESIPGPPGKREMTRAKKKQLN